MQLQVNHIRSAGVKANMVKKAVMPLRQSHMPHPHGRMMLLAPLAALLLGGCGAIPQVAGRSQDAPPRPASASAPSAPAARIAASGPLRQCHSELQKAQVQFTPLPDRYLNGGCTQLGAVRMASLDLSRFVRGAGRLNVANLGPVTCPMAQRFARWAQYGVARAARQILGSDLVEIETLGSYNCRKIAGSLRLSQHAHANAIDVAAFVLADGRRITVKNGWNGSRAERKFLRTVHGSACKRFGTVLGPEFNAAHRDHLHLDMAKNKNFCR
ncbi:MAG: extensin family protein [Pseudomonadota bacterium]